MTKARDMLDKAEKTVYRSGEGTKYWVIVQPLKAIAFALIAIGWQLDEINKKMPG